MSTRSATVCLLLFSYLESMVVGDLQKDIQNELNNRSSPSLFRNKRYLVFPEGSSFQVVFDLAYPTLDGIGFYVFGNTAALAWELPSTPVFLDKKFHKKPMEEPEPEPDPLPPLDEPDFEHDWASSLLGWDEGWQKRIGSVSSNVVPNGRYPVQGYARPSADGSRTNFINPAGQYSVRRPVYSGSYAQNPNIKRAKFPASLSDGRRRIDDHFDSRTVHYNIHRRTRRELYEKFEQLLGALIKDGKACVLKTICKVHKLPSGNKGTLWQEFLKTVFKVKPDESYEDEDQYDLAANSRHDCEEIYPECKGNVLSRVLTTIMKSKKF